MKFKPVTLLILLTAGWAVGFYVLLFLPYSVLKTLFPDLWIAWVVLYAVASFVYGWFYGSLVVSYALKNHLYFPIIASHAQAIRRGIYDGRRMVNDIWDGVEVEYKNPYIPENAKPSKRLKKLAWLYHSAWIDAHIKQRDLRTDQYNKTHNQ
jgi:hypothetical protein